MRWSTAYFTAQTLSSIGPFRVQFPTLGMDWMGINMKRLVALLLALSMVLASPSALVAGQPQLDRSVDLTPCKFSIGLGAAKHDIDAQCGVVKVPEDRSRPDGRKLDIHFVFLAATKPDAKGLPIFHFEGGPGGSAISGFGSAWFSAFRTIREKHDVVLIDQRGTGQSAPLQCTEITRAAFDDLAKPLSDAESEKLQIDRLGACLTRLSVTNDPAFYTSTVLADDTDAVRSALGYDQIDVFGNSYGTWLAQIYLARHGEHVQAMVLDSTVGPWNNYLLGANEHTEAALNKIFDLCKADTLCNRNYPDLPGQLQTALDKLDQEPVTTSSAGTITNKTYKVAMTSSRLLEAIQAMLYQSANASLIPQAISQAADGNFLLTAATLVSFVEQTDDLALGLYYSVHCSETVPFLDDKTNKPTRGEFFGRDDNAGQLADVCKVWRSAEVDKADVAPVKSDRPVLILSGALDPITPVSFAEETHTRLSKSTVAVFPYQAHGPTVGSKCAQNLIFSFLDAPDRKLDSSCTAQDIKPVFLGAYKVDLAPFSNAKFSANIPKGWTVQADESSGPMTFFASPDRVQLLGIGIFKGQKMADAQKSALDVIEKAYGPVEIQQEASQSAIIFTIKIVIHSLDRPDYAFLGMLLIRQSGKDSQVVWQAAPSNIFQAVVLSVAPIVFASVNPR
jgi:pimeloyl-ACP methyl ester carboxylesterase